LFYFELFFSSESLSAKLREVIGQMDGMLENHEGCGETDSNSSRKVSRLELNVKKDSGYGSQGLIVVDQVKQGLPTGRKAQYN
jgi:hypothetical protein